MADIESYSTDKAMNTIEYEEDYFTETGYQGYRDYPLNEIRVQKIIDITNPRSVLDVGCAYGFIVKRLLDKGIHAVGMDISHWAEKQGVIPEHFVRQDLTDTPYPFGDKEFDLLFCEDVLEHIDDTLIDKVMAEFDRVAHKRILALTFDWHIKVSPHLSKDGRAPGHINLHHQNWWFGKIPNHTWLFLPPVGIQDSNIWLYKA